MYQTLIEFLDFIGINGNYPQTIGDFIAWFVLVITCVCVIRFIMNSFFEVVHYVRKGS